MTRHSRTGQRTNQMLAAGMVLGAGYALARLRSPGRLRLRTPGAAATPRAPRGGARERTPGHHGVPLVPIQLDGSRVRPDKVKEFAGQPLHSVADERAMLEGVLQVFTTVEQASTYIREGQPPGPGQVGDRSTDAATAAAPLAAGAGAPPSNPLAVLTLWEHVNFTGAGWDFWGSWGAISNFTCVYPT
jgi:hypothetical protein